MIALQSTLPWNLIGVLEDKVPQGIFWRVSYVVAKRTFN